MPGQRPIRRGTEFTGIPEVVPGAISIPNKAPAGIAGLGGSSSASDADQDSIILSPLDSRAVTTNVAGSATSTVNLSTLDSHLTTKGISYPGGSSDDNNTQWEVPIPSGMDPASPNITVRLHLLVAS